MKYCPVRTCIACRTKGTKEQFIKIVRNSGKFLVDDAKKLEGRGFYVCKNQACIDKVILKKILNKVAKTNCGEEIYLSLKEIQCEQN